MEFNVCHLLGCGGTGSHLATPLIQQCMFHAGVYDFLFYDGDSYETNNFTRQVMSVDDIGKNKATSTVDRLRQSFKDVRFTAVERYVTPAVMTAYLDQYESDDKWQLVIMAIDSDASRHELIKAIDKSPHNVAVILPGNGYNTCNVLWYLSDKSGKAIPCHPFDMAENWARPKDKPRYSCQYEADSSPQLITANFAAAFFTLSVVRALTDDRIIPPVLTYDDNLLTLKTEGLCYT